MKRKNTTRNALFTSVISLLLCVSMLVGTTFAWFTDSVESGRNVIAAGNLDVELYHSNKADVEASEENKVTGTTTLFDDVTPNLWEPGAMAYENLMIVNAGTLALQYTMDLTVLNETVVEEDGVQYKLSDVIMVGYKDGGFTSTTREGVIGEVTKWTPLADYALNKNGIKMLADATETFGLVLYWQPNSAEVDNRYNLNNGKTTIDGSNALKLDIGIELFATQEMEEPDSFGKDYDEAATTVNPNGSASLTVANAPSTNNEATTTVEAPENAFNPGDKVEIKVSSENTLYNVTSDNGAVASVDVVMLVNGVETDGTLSEGVYTVTTYIQKGLTGVKVYYEGTEHDSTYDSETGKLVFTTTHFSEYVVKADKAVAYNVAADAAYATAADVVTAIKGDTKAADVTIADSDKQAVVDAAENAGLSTKEMNALKDGLAAAKGSWSSTEYLTLEAAMADAQANSTITLLADVTVDADNTITIDKNITLDLNGHTVTGITDDADKNDDGKLDSNDNEVMFDVRGNLTVKNGTMTIEHNSDNFGWAACTEIFYVGFNGTLNVENATLENKGGSDMAYAIDMVNADGKGTGITVNITDSTVKSSYIPVRVFNNGSGMNNVTIKNSVIEGVSRALWVHIYSDKDNGGKGIKDATLNLNIFGNGNTYTAANPDRIIEFGFDDEINFTADGAQLVKSAEELATALTAGGTIVLTADVEGGFTIPEGVETTLNLNGHTITAPEYVSSETVCAVKNEGTLIIEGNGTIAGNGYTALYSTGNLTVNGGNFTAGEKFGLLIDNIYGTEASVAVINGGTFTGVGVYNPTNVTINGGTFNVGDDPDGAMDDVALFVSPTFVGVPNTATVTLNGGIFNGNIYVYDDGITETVFTNNGATINGEVQDNG